jgi:4-hydroxy-4-methyl-2-oxoglutarate aldolase
MPQPTAEQLEAVRNIPTPAIANAIETFDIRPRQEGFMSPEISSIFPDMGGMIGYAVTAVISAEKPSTSRVNVSRPDWFDEILKIPAPRVIVMHDLDYPTPVGSFWGEVQANIHTRLGCVGTVTDGGVRDLDEMRDKDFNAFAAAVLVSHANIHIVDVNVPITVGGLTVKPGDLVLGDQHGVTEVPLELVPEMPAAVARVEAKERNFIDLCDSPDFTLDKLKAMYPG